MSFAVNMAVKQKALNFALKYPLATKIVDESFYADDALTGADTVEEAVESQAKLQGLFSEAGFLYTLEVELHNEPTVLQHVYPDLLDSNFTHVISDPEDTKTIGLEWNASMDHFHLMCHLSRM